MEMTLHRALAQRKTTKARLAKELETAGFITTTVGTSGKVKSVPVTEVNKTILGNYDRITALMENLYKLSTAINRANNGIGDDTTNLHTVDFDGRQATLSSILAEQEVLRYRKQMVDIMSKQLANVKNQIASSEADVEARCDQFLVSMGGGDKSKLSAQDIDQYSTSFHKNNDLKLVDPLGLEARIAKLKDRNEFLEVETDSKISEINAMTKVEVPDM